MVAIQLESNDQLVATARGYDTAQSLDVRAGALDLLPIPAVMVTIADGTLRFEDANGPFRLAGLGATAERSPLAALLGGRVRSFLTSARENEHLTWQVGDAVDCRYYRVMFARARIDPGLRCLVTLIDQTSEVRTAHSLRREMLTDSLTGLPNRAGFSDCLEELIEKGPPPPAGCAVLVVDLDRFNRVNACLGSLAGDELLTTVARRLRGALRARDTLARVGGDEFAILLALDEGSQEATQAARRIEATLAAPFRLSDLEIRMSSSIGVALSSEDERDAETLIRNAQFAVNRSKTSGVVEVYHARAFVIAREQFTIETELRHAIDGEHLHLEFQPIIDLATGRVASFEALARWTDRDGCKHRPSDFIPVAEESGLIVPLGRWAIESAVRALATWDANAQGNAGVSVAINISPIQMQRDSIAPVIEQALVASGVAGERLVLELTESALITDPDRVANTLHALRGLGTTLAMDDFGTGYSNLAHLQKLPIDVLKIDQSFVTDMLGDRDKVAIVRAILSLAQTLGMRTTAEGIETIEVGQTLAALGCNHGQGFAYARPLGAEAAFAFLAECNQLPTS